MYPAPLHRNSCASLHVRRASTASIKASQQHPFFHYRHCHRASNWTTVQRTERAQEMQGAKIEGGVDGEVSTGHSCVKVSTDIWPSLLPWAGGGRGVVEGRGLGTFCQCATYVAWSAPCTGCGSHRNGSGSGRAAESHFVRHNHRKCTSAQSRQASLPLSSGRLFAPHLGRPSLRQRRWQPRDSAPPLRVESSDNNKHARSSQVTEKLPSPNAV